MECQICSRASQAALRFHCLDCARDSLYHLRLDLAQTLVEKEVLGRQVNYVLLPSHGRAHEVSTMPSTNIPLEESAKRHLYQQNLDKIANFHHRIEQISHQAEVLRSRIKTSKAELAERRKAISQLRHRLPMIIAKVRLSQEPLLEPLRKQIKKRSVRHDMLLREIVSARVFLCREAALLAGLSRYPGVPVPPRRTTTTSSTQLITRDVYMIAGVPIPDLRQLATASPAQVSHTLSSLARLVVIVCHYLAIRVPAEITLPYYAYPSPTMFTPASSYLTPDVAFPTPQIITVTNREIDSDTGDSLIAELPIADVDQFVPPPASIAKQRPSSRPRPLQLLKPLPQLLRDDTKTYSLFLEGATLLAWDIAWLCRSQDMSLSSALDPSSISPTSQAASKSGKNLTDWEEVCALGRNLYHLLINPRRGSQTSSARPTLGQRYSSTNTNKELPLQGLGVRGHGTAHSRAVLDTQASSMVMSSQSSSGVLAGGGATSFAAVVDRLKAYLSAEASGNEWEVLDLVGDHDGDGRGGLLATNAASASLAGPETDVGSAPGTSGWTKLRSRG